MKITDNRGKTLAFGDIPIGELFEYEGKIYLKTMFFGENEENTLGFNAVETRGYGVDVFSDEQLVKTIKYNLVFEN